MSNKSREKYIYVSIILYVGLMWTFDAISGIYTYLLQSRYPNDKTN